MINITHERGCKCGIYKIENLVTHKFYIGSSKNIYYRLRRHLSDLRKGKHANPIMTNSFNKHGEHVFRSTILEETSSELLLEREEFWINSLNPILNCMGMKIQRPVISDEMKRKVSDSVSKAIKEGRLSCGKKSIDVFNLKGEKIGTYESMKAVTLAFPVSHDSIKRVLIGKHQQNKGFIFKFTKDNVTEVVYKKVPRNMSKLFKSVICTNIITNETVIYKSTKEVKSIFGVSIVHNLKCGVIYKGKYTFKYAT